MKRRLGAVFFLIGGWVCGEALKRVVSHFDAVGKYSAVPALRYSYIHHSPPAIAGVVDTLLVVLTHSVEESMAILGANFWGTIWDRASIFSPEMRTSSLTRSEAEKPSTRRPPIHPA